MDKAKIVKLSIFFGLLAIGAGVYAFVKTQMMKAMSYCYKFSKIVFINTSKDRFTIDLTIKFRNQSDIRVNLTNYMFEVWINNKFITTIASVTNTDLLANAVSELVVRIDFNPSSIFELSDVLKLIGTALTDPKNFLIKLKGKVSVGINFIKLKDFPIDMTMNLADIMAPAPATAKEEIQKMDCRIV